MKNQSYFVLWLLASSVGLLWFGGVTFAANETSPMPTAQRVIKRTAKKKLKPMPNGNMIYGSGGNWTGSWTGGNASGMQMGGNRPIGADVNGDGMKGNNKPPKKELLELGDIIEFIPRSDAEKAALVANDYTAFTSAWKASHENGNVPTQDQFNTLVTSYKKQLAIKSAVENNDYMAFASAITPTQDEFLRIVARYNTNKALDAAIKANDYSAFINALTADPYRPAVKANPTQEEFNKMVANYNK